MKKNKKIKVTYIIIISAVILIGILVNLEILSIRTIKIGNNKSSQEILNDIVNISSYEMISEIVIEAGKTKNQYIVNQKYISPDEVTQEVIEPENISGVRTIKSGNTLIVENTILGISKIFENYEYISNNVLDLVYFIEQYKDIKSNIFTENEKEIIVEIDTKINGDDICQRLYIDKNTQLPSKMEINNTSKNTNIYILYKEVKLNSL